VLKIAEFFGRLGHWQLQNYLHIWRARGKVLQGDPCFFADLLISVILLEVKKSSVEPAYLRSFATNRKPSVRIDSLNSIDRNPKMSEQKVCFGLWVIHFSLIFSHGFYRDIH